MDFSFSEEQEAVRELADRIFTDLSTQERLRELETQDDGDRFDRKLWSELASAGLLGIALPEDVGGAGLGFLETGLLAEAAGRTAALVPVVETLAAAAPAIAEFGSDAQKQRWLPGVVSGATVVTTALVELGGTPDAPATVAEPSGDSWTLTGVKACVPSGTFADAVLVTARIEPDGVAVFVVDTGSAGVTIERQTANNGQPEGLITLSGVSVGPGPGRCRSGVHRPGRRVHQAPGAVRQAHRHLPGRGPAGRRRLCRHRGHPPDRLAGRLAPGRGPAGGELPRHRQPYCIRRSRRRHRAAR